MEVSDADRERMFRLVADLEAVETDEEPNDAVRQVRIAAANDWRTVHGIPPLEDGDEEPPELEFHRYARAIGLSGNRG